MRNRKKEVICLCCDKNFIKNENDEYIVDEKVEEIK